MSELELVHSRLDCGDDTTCSAKYTELDDAFDLVHDAHVTESDVCADGVCPVIWKPERPNAA